MNGFESFFKNFLEPFSYLIYAIVFFLEIRRDRAFKKKVLFVYYLCAIVLLLVASFMAMYVTNQIDNTWLYNTFYLITVCVHSYYFYHLLNNKTKKYTAIFLLSINLILFIVYDIILEHFFNKFNGYIIAICFLSIVVYALLYFDQLLRNVNELNILYQFDFWLVSGFLLYFLGCFFIILYYESANIDQRGDIWALQNAIIFLSSVVTLTGYLYIHSRKKLY